MKKNIRKDEEHRGNAQQIINNYLEEIKMVNEAPKYFYSRDGGVKRIDD